MRTIKRSMGNRNDERYTPPLLVEPILRFILPKSKIWCPFDTEDSEFVIGLSQAGHHVIYSHLWDGKDFFTFEPAEYDYVISNPPFSAKKEVLTRLYALGKPFAMLINLECLNYQEIGKLFYEHDSDLQLLIMTKKVSFDGQTASFNTSYFCRNMLPRDILFYDLPHNNTGRNFVGSRMKRRNDETIS